MTPAEELRAAATKLREMAADALGPPWALDEDGTAVFSAEVQPYGAPCVTPQVTEEDGAWIALVHPGLAEPLALVLEDAVKRLDDFTAAYGDRALPVVAYELAVARVINGSGT